VASKASGGKVQYIKGTHDAGKVRPQGKIDFPTKEVENDYMEYNSGTDYKSQSGKAKLLGMAMKVMKGSEVLAQYETSADAKKYWDK
jgi:hypothetical protein